MDLLGLLGAHNIRKPQYRQQSYPTTMKLEILDIRKTMYAHTSAKTSRALLSMSFLASMSMSLLFSSLAYQAHHLFGIPCGVNSYLVITFPSFAYDCNGPCYNPAASLHTYDRRCIERNYKWIKYVHGWIIFKRASSSHLWNPYLYLFCYCGENTRRIAWIQAACDCDFRSNVNN